MRLEHIPNAFIDKGCCEAAPKVTGLFLSIAKRVDSPTIQNSEGCPITKFRGFPCSNYLTKQGVRLPKRCWAGLLAEAVTISEG